MIMERVLLACPLLMASYKPTFWATNPHVQTLVSVLRQLSIRANFRRHLLPAPDGCAKGALVASFYNPAAMRTASMQDYVCELCTNKCLVYPTRRGLGS